MVETQEMDRGKALKALSVLVIILIVSNILTYTSMQNQVSLLSMREPEVLLSDDFEYSPLAWDTYGTYIGEEGYFVGLTTTQYRFSGQGSLHLQPDTDPNDTAEAVKYFGISQSLKLKASLEFSLPDYFGKFFAVGLVRFGEGTSNRAFVRYDIQYRKWQYEDSYLNFADVPDGNQTLWANPWVYNRLIVKVDFNTNTYVSIQVNEKIIDMSMIPIWLDNRWKEVWKPSTLISIYVGTTEGLCVFHVDCVQVEEIL